MRLAPLAVFLLLASGCDRFWTLSVTRTVSIPADPDCAKGALLRIVGIDSVWVGPVAQASGVGSEFLPWSQTGFGRVVQEAAGDSILPPTVVLDLGRSQADRLGIHGERGAIAPTRGHHREVLCGTRVSGNRNPVLSYGCVV